jgi:hypothetical protein
MVQKQPQVILGPAGLPVWECDPQGDTTQTGTLTGTGLVLAENPSPTQPPPGYLTLYSPDGSSLAVVGGGDVGSTVSFGAGFAPVVGAGATVTGVTAETLLASGMTVPAGGLKAGQLYRFIATGTLTTTADTQTVHLRFRFGGLTGTLVLDFGTQNPNSSSTISGAAWNAHFDIMLVSATSMVVAGDDALDFFPTAETTQTTTVANTSAEQFVLTVQPSASGVDMACTGFANWRIA